MSNNRNKHAERAKSAPSTAYDDSPMDTDDVPSTSGGELSMSVEETNKLRIAMGLKPLNVEDKATKEKEQQKKREEAEKEAKTLEIQARIDKAKKDREKNKKIAGKSLGEELAGEEEDDTVSWVLKSRQLEEERKLAEKRSKALEELDKGGSDDEGPRRSSKSGSAQATAKGLKVAHGIEDILDTNADSIILTLKDTPILDKYNLNEDDDELENLQLVEKEKLKLYEARKKKKPVYDAHDEEKKNILPQYDDDVETKHKKSFVIDDSTINVYQKRVEEEAQKVMEGRKFVQYNLEMDKTFANEYMTQEEAAVKFKKTKKKTTVKKKKLRQKDESETAVSDVNNNAREGNNIIIEDSMDIAPTQEGRKDHGSRNASVKLARDAQKAQNDAERRQKNYEIAKQKAEEETKSLVNGRAEDDEDKALLKSLSKAREMAKPEKKSDPLAELAARVQASKQKKDVEMASTTDDPNLMFTATTEFIKNIQPDDTYFSKPKKKDKIKEAELEKEISEDLSTQEDMLRAQQAKERKLKKEQEDKEMREAEERAKQEEEEEEEEEDEDENDEPDVGSSMTAALQFLKSRVGVEKMETFVGRKNDKTVDFDENNDPAPEINLSYIDEFGRPLTQKEAFRQLSWKFHGKKPGKNKQAKRMRQMEQEKARLKMANNDTPLMTVAKLQAEQERTQQAYVVLSGKSHGTESSYDAPKASKPPAEKGESTPAPKRPITTVAPTGSVMQGAFTEFKINAPKKPKT